MKTEAGDARYLIERIAENHAVLVRDGKRITVPIKQAPTGGSKH